MTPNADQNAEIGTVTQFSISGITTSVVDIALVGCENVSVDENGVATFPNSTNPGGSGNVANLTGAGANAITVINGSVNNQNQYANNIAVTNNSVSFSVSNSAADCYVAVVFSDAPDNDNLELGTDNQPTDAFGVSGDVQVLPAEQTDGQPVSGTVAYVDLGDDLFTNGTNTFYYDSNDEFLLAGTTPPTALTLAEFEARLSVGDGTTGLYRSNPANQSSFTLTDSAPAAPTTVDARNPTGTRTAAGGIEVFFNDSATTTTASYNVLRATATQPVAIGDSVTCPDAQTTAGAGAYSTIGSVTDTTAGATDGYIYHDTTAQVPASGATAPQYCYTVQAVDETGDTGPLADEDGPNTAQAASTTTGMSFEAAETVLVNANTIRADYNNTVNAATVAANGSDFRVTSTVSGVSTNVVVTAAAVEAGNPDAVLITTATAVPTGGTVTVTSQTGTDSNTVCAGTATTNCQVAGQSVIVDTTGADVTAPEATDATFTDFAGTGFNGLGNFGDEDGDVITVTYGENVVLDGTATITIDGTTYTDGVGVTFDATTTTLTVTVSAQADAANTAITATSEVDGTTNVEDAAGNAAVGYPELID